MKPAHWVYPFPKNKADPNYTRKVAEHHAAQYIEEQLANSTEVNYTEVAEHTCDCLCDLEEMGENVYDWLDDPDHWIWDLPIEIEEKLDARDS